jgi:ornithine decarboxylase
MTIIDFVRDLDVAAAHQVKRARPQDLLETPFLELETSVVAERVMTLSRTFPNTAIHYAVTANPHPDVLATVAAAGANFAVTCPAEARVCLESGAASDDLIYCTPIKERDDIAEAARLGVRLFVVDTVSEVRKIAAAAPGTAVLCRLVTSDGGSRWPRAPRHGCSVSQGVDILRLAADLGLDAAGVSFHVGSNHGRPNAWRAPIADAATVFGALGRHGMTPWLLDLGGGFPGGGERPVPPLDAYGAVIEDQLSRSFGHHRPRTIIEPGRALVGDAGALVSTVVRVLRRGQTRWIHLDTAPDIGLIGAFDDAIGYRIETSADGGPTGPCVLAGPTRESAQSRHPVLTLELPLNLEEGDVVRLRSAGAYPPSYAGSDPLAVVVG